MAAIPLSDPMIYTDNNGLEHDHSRIEYTTTWKCPQGHLSTTRFRKGFNASGEYQWCLQCLLDKQAAQREVELAQASANRTSDRSSVRGDHDSSHDNNAFWAGGNRDGGSGAV